MCMAQNLHRIVNFDAENEYFARTEVLKEIQVLKIIAAERSVHLN